MSDAKESAVIEEQKEWKTDSSFDIWVVILLALLFGGGFGISENPRISELEKKVARLEGQMSMIGGRKCE